MKTTINQFKKISFFTAGFLSLSSPISAITLELSVLSESNTPESAVATVLTVAPAPGVCGQLQLDAGNGVILSPDQNHMLGFCTQLSAVDQTQTFDAYRALSARSINAITSFTANGFYSLNVGDITKRLAALRKSSMNASNKTASLYRNNNLIAGSETNQLTGGGASADEQVIASGDLNDNRLSGFVTGNFVNAEQEETATLAGYDAGLNALFIGLDYRFTNDFFAGIAIKSLTGDIDLIENTGTVDVSDNSFSFYGNYNLTENVYFQSTLTYGQGSYDITRRIDFTINNVAFNEVADSDTDGDGFSFSFSSGYDHYFVDTGLSSNFDFNINYARTDIDGFVENGAQGFNLVVADQTIESLSTKATAQISKAISTSFGVIIPEFSASWKHEFETDGNDVITAFAIDPDKTFGYTTDERESDFFVLSLATSMILPHGIMGFLQYEQILGIDNYDNASFNIGARIEF